MRDILFRGKGTDGEDKGKWVYGVPVTTSGGDCYIIEGVTDYDAIGYDVKMVRVDPDTVGQYTGINLVYADTDDDVETMIFEGDIIEGAVEFCDGTQEQYRGVVRYIDGMYALDSSKDITHYDYSLGYFIRVIAKSKHDIKIIGNIYDNPELLEEVQT